MSNPSPKKKNGSTPSDFPAPTTATNTASSNATAPPQPRQIRFVSSDGQPPTKRRRVTAA
jgi:hypothetical protein